MDICRLAASFNFVVTNACYFVKMYKHLYARTCFLTIVATQKRSCAPYKSANSEQGNIHTSTSTATSLLNVDIESDEDYSLKYALDKSPTLHSISLNPNHFDVAGKNENELQGILSVQLRNMRNHKDW